MFEKKMYEVVVYNNERKMKKGVNRMAKKGYEVHSTTTDSRSGCLRSLTLGIMRPKVFHTVTFKLA